MGTDPSAMLQGGPSLYPIYCRSPYNTPQILLDMLFSLAEFGQIGGNAFVISEFDNWFSSQPSAERNEASAASGLLSLNMGRNLTGPFVISRFRTMNGWRICNYLMTKGAESYSFRATVRW